ncbi:50S ribosomal protein L6 [Candidatus Gullanella endobia]|uniref:Large ribosomal subunit protein uL6 n=1 Tax=Candidatus Gullanella endobia TaxID=1070130 RepID=A0A143WR31_9ENTR|nr:50S ribosomal protein L6 [Candidatus Gullanella endobia]CUX96205.1 50S ribosomal protein L6 [Candidatus Gullanella endobia]
MSRVAKAHVLIPAGVDVKLNGQVISIKSKNGELTRIIHKIVDIQYINNQLIFSPREDYSDSWAITGTTRAILNSMVVGVTKGFIKKLKLIGVGYRATVKDNVINLSLGFSHSIDYQLPVGVIAECLNQTEIILKGADKQIIGQVAANIRAYRRPEPYQGKGIHYSDEIIRTKEPKKK